MECDSNRCDDCYSENEEGDGADQALPSRHFIVRGGFHFFLLSHEGSGSLKPK